MENVSFKGASEEECAALDVGHVGPGLMDRFSFMPLLDGDDITAVASCAELLEDARVRR